MMTLARLVLEWASNDGGSVSMPTTILVPRAGPAPELGPNDRTNRATNTSHRAEENLPLRIQGPLAMPLTGMIQEFPYCCRTPAGLACVEANAVYHHAAHSTRSIRFAVSVPVESVRACRAPESVSGRDRQRVARPDRSRRRRAAQLHHGLPRAGARGRAAGRARYSRGPAARPAPRPPDLTQRHLMDARREDDRSLAHLARFRPRTRRHTRGAARTR